MTAALELVAMVSLAVGVVVVLWCFIGR